ncbi:YdcF family protein [Gordonia jinghuaiqii]|uniref:YdcF family protein n=2 Tax=Gordonia jinghuaiqii TaxID=2758710 RepID=A0A7D7QK63_9ACTN|nr:YdcF family protein [Gordonia jinghuaiqii]QMT03744.1 YdcF family protein [Gordonia jinghuaiqii]
MRRAPWRRLLAVAVVAALLAVTAFWAVGYQLFYREHQDPLQRVDAIVVLGGDDDGREDYGLQLARAGYADTLVISNPHRYHKGSDPVRRAHMRTLCNSSTAERKVVCFEPEPTTTRGEAMFVRDLAASRGWTSVMVISWRYHLVRARYIFGQCYSGEVVMRSVPRSYARSAGEWTNEFVYQYAALAKAAAVAC